jgi:hypothetical protein
VEIDLVPGAWRGHGHDGNPAYRGVILHVVWEGEARAAGCLPTLELRPVLDATVEELEDWLGAGVQLPPALPGRCATPFCGLPDAVRGDLLRQAALVRLRRKGDELGARARQVGWDQALWEGLFGALGYRRNVWPMRRLAEVVPRLASPSLPASPLLTEARLLGLAGLLPLDADRGRSPSGVRVRELWDLWWREREDFAEVALPRAVWNLAGLRPANQPPRRLALAARWLHLGSPTLPERLQAWFREELPDRRLRVSLVEALRVEDDAFWSWHWTFRSARLPRPRPLLGAARATDLGMNVILPWFWVRARMGGNEGLRRRAEGRYLAWPCGQDNAVLRLAWQRFGGRDAPRSPRTAAQQQGLLQIVRDFCDETNALCEGCGFPALLCALAGREYPVRA